MEELMNGLLVFLGIILLVVLIIYILQAILLNKLNKLMYGKGTPMAWIPVANIYLLGKLTVNKLVGWILVICCFSTGTVTTTVNGESTTTTLLPGNIGKIVSLIYSISVFVLFIYAVIKYFKLKKEKNIGYSVSNNSTVTSDGTTNLSNHTETVTSSQQPSTNIQSNGVQTQPATPVNANANQTVQQSVANPQVSSTPVQPAATVSASASQAVQQTTTDSSQNQSVQNSDPFNW